MFEEWRKKRKMVVGLIYINMYRFGVGGGGVMLWVIVVIIVVVFWGN